MKRLLSVAMLALVITAGASAASPDSRLAGIATQASGHAVTVICPDSEADWVSLEQAWRLTTEVDGYTNASPTIWLSPRACSTLNALLNYGPDAVGPYWASLGIKTLLHEAQHQRGVNDEPTAECNALAGVKQAAVTYFGYPATVTQTIYVTRWVTVRVAKATKRVKTLAARTVTAPNLALTELQDWAVRWHRAMPAAYQGSC